MRDLQTQGESNSMHTGISNILTGPTLNDNANLSSTLPQTSSNFNIPQGSWANDSLFSLASVASNPSQQNDAAPSYSLNDIVNDALGENLSPSGSADSNFEHTFAWLFGSSTDAKRFTIPSDNFSSILFAQPASAMSMDQQVQPSFDGNYQAPVSTSNASIFGNAAAEPATSSTLQVPAPVPEVSSNGSNVPNTSLVSYPIDISSVTVGRTNNGNILDEPKPIITPARRTEMLNILHYSADRDDFERCFTCKKLNSLVELYFICFDPFYPVLHRSSMAYRHISPFVLLAMVSALSTSFVCLN
jgi:hypothetical protein